jgi:hypothetical protein
MHKQEAPSSETMQTQILGPLYNQVNVLFVYWNLGLCSKMSALGQVSDLLASLWPRREESLASLREESQASLREESQASRPE